MGQKFRRAYSRRNVNLLLYQWIALDRIAHQTGSYNLRGTRKGNRSWRSLLRRIAEGELIVVKREVAQEANVMPLPKVAEFIGPPIKRGPGRPIANNEPFPCPADWCLTSDPANVQNPDNALHQNGVPPLPR